MQVKKCIIFFHLIICNGVCFSQINNKAELIDKSRSYYHGLKIFSVNTLEKRKPPVGEDTSISRYRCMIDNERKMKLFLPSKNNDGIFISAKDEYVVNLDSIKYVFTKAKDRKYTSFDNRH